MTVVIVDAKEAKRARHAKYMREWNEKNPEKSKANSKRRRETHKDSIAAAVKASNQNHPDRYLWFAARQRAHKLGVEFTIEPSDIVIPVACPVFGTVLGPVRQGLRGDLSAVPSIDRIDSSKGYVKDNVRVISLLANMMKGKATAEQLQVFAVAVLAGKV